jgi:hypothetical protein
MHPPCNHVHWSVENNTRVKSAVMKTMSPQDTLSVGFLTKRRSRVDFVAPPFSLTRPNIFKANERIEFVEWEQ